MVKPLVFPKRPAGHRRQKVAPDALHRPVGQGPSHTGVAVPGLAAAEPALHGEHVTAPASLHFPAGHTSVEGVGDVDASRHAYPAVHGVHAEAPAVLYVPAGHMPSMGLGRVDPGAHRYPALHGPSHRLQGVCGADPKRPWGHAKQNSAPASLYRPAAQATAVGDTEPEEQAKPALQLPVQDAVGRPGVAPYNPAAQSVQLLDPDREYRPDGHIAAVGDVEPAMHAYPALQFPVHRGVVDPLADPYRPGAQGPLQLEEFVPGTDEYKPAAQSVHAPALAKLKRPAGHNAAVAFVDPAGHA